MKKMVEKIVDKMRQRANELFEAQAVTQVLAWRMGAFPYYPQPAFFKDINTLSEMAYDRFCTANLSKYAIEASRQSGRTLLFLRSCDAYSFEQLIKENQVQREKMHIMPYPAKGA